MTGDGIVWRAWSVASQEGTLLLPEHRMSRALVNTLMLPVRKLEHRRLLGDGSEGRVFKQWLWKLGSVAIKVFHSFEQDNFRLGTVEDLQVNYALYHGLERIPQTGRWRMRAPELFGAFLPHEASKQARDGCETNVPRWAMEAVPHRILDDAEKTLLQESPDFPSPRAQKYLFSTAVNSFGVPGLESCFDDDLDMHNVLLEAMPSYFAPGSLVMIDMKGNRSTNA